MRSLASGVHASVILTVELRRVWVEAKVVSQGKGSERVRIVLAHAVGITNACMVV